MMSCDSTELIDPSTTISSTRGGMASLHVAACFARRRGWYDALGIDAEEDLIMNKKWGDPVCQLAVRFKVK